MLCSADHYPRFVALLSTFVVSSMSVSETHAMQSLQDLPTGFFESSDFRYVGPVGNRVSAVVGEPGNPNVYYLGAVSYTHLRAHET